MALLKLELESAPFETIIEAFHELLLDRQLGSLRLGDAIWRQLLEVIGGGGGLQAFVALTAELAGTPVFLLARDGRIVAASHIGADLPPERHRSTEDVTIAGVRWGSIVVAGPRSAMIDSVLERAAALVSPELARSADPRNRPSQATALLLDMVENRLPSVSEIRARCEVLGFPSQRGRPLIGIAVAADRRAPRQPLLEGAERACRDSFGTAMVGELEDDIIAIARVPDDEEPKQLRRRLERLTKQLTESVERTSGHSVLAVGASTLADDFDDLPRSIQQAREVVDVARRLGAHHATLLSRDVGVYRLLVPLQGRRELSEFISEQLGPLLDYDTRHGTDLVLTLDVYLAHALCKANAARVLGIRRQTLYDRLTRIEQILGAVVLTDYQHRNALSLALCAWRLRTGLDPARELV
jgi:purine catabolism regulator